MGKKTDYEETTHPTIEEAYNELSQEGFAVWIRLMVCTEDQLLSGKRELGKVCNYSVNRFYRIMSELHNKDFVRYIKPEGLGKPHVVLLHKRAMIAGRNHFVRISGSSRVSSLRSITADEGDKIGQSEYSALCSFHSETEAESSETKSERKVSSRHRRSKKKKKSKKNGNLEKRDANVPPREEILAKGREKYVVKGEDEVSLEEALSEEFPRPSPLEPPSPKNNIKGKSPRASHFGDNLTSSSSKKRARGKDSKEPGKPPRRETTLSKKMAEKRQKIKDAEKSKRKAKKVIKTWKIDYSMLDSHGNPSVSFGLGSKKREEMLEKLNVKIKGRGVKRSEIETRNSIIKKLGSEFSRIYCNYRNLIQTARGRESRFMMPPGHEKYCEKIALQCIYNEITPRQLLEYWDEHIKDFAERTFNHPYPTLSFLSGVYASEQVAAALYSSTEGGTQRWKSGDFHKGRKSVPPSGSHSFFDIEGLDEDLKSGLRNAGFDVGGKYDDRYLLTVQKTARAIARGKKLFVGGILKKMVDWAVENLYGEDDE
jgi:hypothetical protein